MLRHKSFSLKQNLVILTFFSLFLGIFFCLFELMRNPLVSVIIPTYNRAEFLPRAIDSVLAQTFTDFELIVIDDGSTDGTDRILKNYARQDKRIKVITQKNCGVSCARNKGLSMARGTYVSMLDSDDFALPEMLERQVLYMRKYPDLAALASLEIRVIDFPFSSKDVENMPVLRSEFFGFSMTPSQVRIAYLFSSMFKPSGSCYKKSFLNEYGILYDENLQSAEDYDFFRQILMHRGLIARVNENWAVVRIHRSHGEDFYRTMNWNSVIVKKRFFAPYWELSGKESGYREFSWEERCVILQKILDNWTDGGWLKKTDVTDYMAKFCTVH